MIPIRRQTMKNPLNQSRICQSPDPWHPGPDIGRMPGATDLASRMEVRSVLVILPVDVHCLRANRYEVFGDKFACNLSWV